MINKDSKTHIILWLNFFTIATRFHCSGDTVAETIRVYNRRERNKTERESVHRRRRRLGKLGTPNVKKERTTIRLSIKIKSTHEES